MRHLDIAMAPLEKGADVEAREQLYGWTPLLWASLKGHLYIAMALMEKAADIEAKGRFGKGAVCMCVLLIANHAQTNIKPATHHTSWTYRSSGLPQRHRRGRPAREAAAGAVAALWVCRTASDMLDPEVRVSFSVDGVRGSVG